MPNEEMLLRLFVCLFASEDWFAVAVMLLLATVDHAWTLGWISGGGGNFDNFIDKQFLGRVDFLTATIVTNLMLSNIFIQIPTTARNQTWWTQIKPSECA